MERKILIIKESESPKLYRGMAVTQGCAEITTGIPPRLKATLKDVGLPYVHTEVIPDPPAPVNEIGSLKTDVSQLRADFLALSNSLGEAIDRITGLESL